MYPYGYGYYFDPTYILIIIGVIITMIASSKMNSTFRRYSRVRCHCGLTGSQAAERILNQAGIYDVSVERVSGNLTDHYDPKNKVLRLSDATYGSDSIAAIGVAAHECGHAVQHQQGYAPLKIRGAMVPAVNLGSNLSWLFILGGVILGMNQTLLNVGILLFSLAVIFQLVTLPVEFNASSRALRILGSTGIMYEDEVGQTRKVLSAAALTYVAVKKGRKPGIYMSWDACKAQVMGFPNARYKGFKTKAEAEAFLNPDANELMQIDEDTLVAYVDGSYDHSQKRFSYGMVLMHDGVERYFAYPYADKELATMRNVAGEIKGSEAAMRFAKENGYKKLAIHYDYEGIQKWCTGEWAAKKEGTQAYQRIYEEMKQYVQIKFVKVKGHSNDKYNDYADMLAKSALGIGDGSFEKKEDQEWIKVR